MQRRQNDFGLPAVDGDAVEVFSDTGKGDAAAVGGTVTTVLGPQLWGRVRAGCGRGQSSDCFKDHSHTVDLGRRGREDFFGAHDRSGVFHYLVLER